MKKAILLIVIVVFLLVTGVAFAVSAPEIDRWVIASGGGTVQSPGGDVVLESTIGQPIVGSNHSGGVEVCSGFWCEFREWLKVYLPAILR